MTRRLRLAIDAPDAVRRVRDARGGNPKSQEFGEFVRGKMLEKARDLVHLAEAEGRGVK
jgi:hypothetical protein